MNKRGAIYTGIIALMTMATIAMVMYSSLGAINEEYSRTNANRIGEVKRVWQNTRFVLDRISGEALADFVKDKNISSGFCDARVISNDSAGASTRVLDYLNSAMSDISNGLRNEISCSISGFNYSASGSASENTDTATITLTLKCEQNLMTGSAARESLYVSYSNDLVFSKQVTTSGASCDVFAIDMQSGQLDANALR